MNATGHQAARRRATPSEQRAPKPGPAWAHLLPLWLMPLLIAIGLPHSAVAS